MSDKTVIFTLVCVVVFLGVLWLLWYDIHTERIEQRIERLEQTR